MIAARARRVEQIVMGELGPVVAASVDSVPSVAELAAIRSAGADLVEYRLDRFEEPRAAVVDHPELVSLMTVRTRGDGGTWEGSEEAWLDLLAQRVDDFDLVDIEIGLGCFADAMGVARDARTQTVVSIHDFDAPLSSVALDRFADRAFAAGADVAKAACVAETESELRVLAGWLVDRPGENLAALAMSSMGPASRCLLPLLGSRLCFAPAGGNSMTPGQMSLEETVRLLRRLSPTFDARKSEELAAPGD